MPEIWRKAIEQELDEKDVRLLNILAKERKFSEEELEDFAKALKISVKEVKERLKVLRGKKILLKDKISIIDQLKIWDGYYIVLIKANISPPIVAPGFEFPTGWRIEKYLEKLKEAEKRLKLNLIRHAYCLQGTEWDILLIISAKSQKEYTLFMDEVAKQGWMSKLWSFTPMELGEQWIFDPIAVPEVEDFKERVEKIKIKR